MATGQMFLVIDNYDSFTWNLVHYLGELGAEPVVVRNDRISVDDALSREPEAIVLSPGPCTPNEAGICLDLIREASATIPMLGVCLGHQAMGQAFGGKVIRAPQMMHGKLSEIRHDDTDVISGINGTFQATRYHSLIGDRATLPAGLRVNADTADGIIMGMAHEKLSLHGVQFHPESIAFEHGYLMLENFLAIAADWNKKQGRATPRAAARQTGSRQPAHLAS